MKREKARYTLLEWYVRELPLVCTFLKLVIIGEGELSDIVTGKGL